LTEYTESCIIIITPSRGARKSKSTKYAESRSRTYTIRELKNLGWNVKHPSKDGNILEEQEAKQEQLDEVRVCARRIT